MTSPTLSLSFCIGPDDPLGTLENVLATARRGGLALSSLHVRNRAQALQVGLLLAGPDSERLALFAHRLRNLHEVHDVACQEILSAGFTAETTDELAQSLSA